MSEGPPVDDPDADAPEDGRGDDGQPTDEAASGPAGSDDGHDPDDPFANLAATDVDEDEIWQDLGADDGDVDGDLFERLAEENPAGEVEPEVHTDGETAVVPKSKYCQRCEYFSSPPALSCGHPGTTIAEVVDTDSFQVRNCPVVAERHGTADVLDAE